MRPRVRIRLPPAASQKKNKESLIKYVEAPPLGRFPSRIILRPGWNYSSSPPLFARSLAWGKHHGSKAAVGYGGTLIRGLVVGDLLWVVVIAFLFAVITGVFG